SARVSKGGAGRASAPDRPLTLLRNGPEEGGAAPENTSSRAWAPESQDNSGGDAWTTSGRGRAQEEVGVRCGRVGSTRPPPARRAQQDRRFRRTAEVPRTRRPPSSLRSSSAMAQESGVVTLEAHRDVRPVPT